ncbi:hypothetical protein NDU88_004539 [Pleurodeles waltl]|uniref:Uncharacterized protein n=1 Tax=Pleurodeles waltl TaxID=8319 RepID=A0AAV7WVT3_PLEWA|nr:hypothetical protein NDU88_004539 [Pleurodeles waltl]
MPARPRSTCSTAPAGQALLTAGLSQTTSPRNPQSGSPIIRASPDAAGAHSVVPRPLTAPSQPRTSVMLPCLCGHRASDWALDHSLPAVLKSPVDRHSECQSCYGGREWGPQMPLIAADVGPGNREPQKSVLFCCHLDRTPPKAF